MAGKHREEDVSQKCKTHGTRTKKIPKTGRVYCLDCNREVK